MPSSIISLPRKCNPLTLANKHPSVVFFWSVIKGPKRLSSGVPKKQACSQSKPGPSEIAFIPRFIAKTHCILYLDSVVTACYHYVFLILVSLKLIYSLSQNKSIHLEKGRVVCKLQGFLLKSRQNASFEGERKE